MSEVEYRMIDLKPDDIVYGEVTTSWFNIDRKCLGQVRWTKDGKLQQLFETVHLDPNGRITEYVGQEWCLVPTATE